MNQRSADVLFCSAAVAGVAALLYALNWRHESTAILREIRASVSRNNNKLRDTYAAVAEHRKVLNDAHKRVCTVTKGSPKPAS